MATLSRTTLIKARFSAGLLLRLSAAGVLVTFIALLVVVIREQRYLAGEQAILDRVSSWDVPGLSAYLTGMNAVTSTLPGIGLALAVLAVLWLIGKRRDAIAFGFVGLALTLVALTADSTIGEIAGRPKPLGDGTQGPSFPSGHVYGSTFLFGFVGYLALRYRIRSPWRVLVVGSMVALALSVGVSRLFVQAHWPTDIIGGYLMGVLSLLILAPPFQTIRKSLLLSSRSGRILDETACPSCEAEQSIASTVLLDPERGTATKVYSPPPVVRLLYWLAFQAPFPYEHNDRALEAAAHRRKIASMLSRYRFGKDLVAPVLRTGTIAGKRALVTEYVPGEPVANDKRARNFLAEVADTFSEAGLALWQIDPHNPHAHTNLRRTPDDVFKIIDLESALVSAIPPKGQWRSTLSQGLYPIFDDIDFDRLRRFVQKHEHALRNRLGADGLVEFRQAIDDGEGAIMAWKRSEPRIWGRLASLLFRCGSLVGDAAMTVRRQSRRA